MKSSHSHSHAHTHTHATLRPGGTCPRAQCGYYHQQCRCTGKTLAVPRHGRSSYSQRAFANGGTKECQVARAPQRSGQRLLRIVTRAPHFKQGREGRKGKNERSWIKGTHGPISWTVGHGRHRRTRVRPIGRGGFAHGLTGRTSGLGFIPGPCPPPWRDPACTKIARLRFRTRAAVTRAGTGGAG
jgi:hypothetical protein